MRQLLTILTIVLWVLTASSAAPRWESVDTPVDKEQTMETVKSGDEVVMEFGVKDGYIYIGTSKPVTVKVFTILGQLISQEQLASGIHRLRMTTRGVYILKVGTSTRRVTI